VRGPSGDEGANSYFRRYGADGIFFGLHEKGPEGSGPEFFE